VVLLSTDKKVARPAVRPAVKPEARPAVKPEVLLFVFLLFSVFLISLFPISLPATPPTNGQSFITQYNDRLVIKDTNQRFRFVGGNHFNLLVKYLWGEFHGLTGEDVFRISAEHDVKVIRFWATCSNGYWSDQCLYFGPNNWKNSRQDFLERFDELVADAEEYEVYLMPVLTDAYYTFKWMGSTTGLNNTEVCQVGNEANLEYKEFVADIVSRYSSSEAILAWEIGNEGQRYCANYEDLLEWYEDTANYIRELDSNHLISTGENNFGSMDKTKFKAVHSSEEIGLASVHIYDEDLHRMVDGVEVNGGEVNGREVGNSEGIEAEIELFISYWTSVAHNELKKPIYFGEIGPYDLAANPDFYDYALKAAYSSGVDGIIIWSWLEGAECDSPQSEGGSCITPTRTPDITERISYWAGKFEKKN